MSRPEHSTVFEAASAVASAVKAMPKNAPNRTSALSSAALEIASQTSKPPLSPIVLAGIVMLAINPGLGLIALAPVPFVVVISYSYGRRARPAIQETQQRIGELTAEAEENISGVRVVKAFAREPRQLARFRNTVGRVFSQAMVATRLEARYNPIVAFLPQLGLAAVLLLGGIEVIHAKLSLGDFTASVLHLGYLGSAVLFFVVILIPAVAWRLGMNAIAAFWFAYVVTRPLGASFADWFSKPRDISGLNYGDGPTAAVMLALIGILVGYTAIARYDIQRPSAATGPRRAGRGDIGRAEPVIRDVTTDPARDPLL